MSDADGIVVYRSQAERAIDQWMWQSGGWQIVLLVAGGLALAFAALALRDWFKGDR